MALSNALSRRRGYRPAHWKMRGRRFRQKNEGSTAQTTATQGPVGQSISRALSSANLETPETPRPDTLPPPQGDPNPPAGTPSGSDPGAGVRRPPSSRLPGATSKGGALYFKKGTPAHDEWWNRLTPRTRQFHTDQAAGKHTDAWWQGEKAKTPGLVVAWENMLKARGKWTPKMEEHKAKMIAAYSGM